MTCLSASIRGSSVLCIIGLFASVSPSLAKGLLDGCNSTATPVGFPASLVVCPAGDGQSLADVGARIDLVVKDPTGNTVEFIPGQDMWILGCSQSTECWSALSSHADAPTDANGETTISGTLAAGGMDIGVHVFLQAVAVLSQPECATQQCLALAYRSVDINGDLAVNMVDLALFAARYPPNTYDAAVDFDYDGTVGLWDLAFFAAHFGHACP